MRFLYYNIAYATGAPESHSHSLLTAHRYLRSSHRHFDRVRDFISEVGADITGVVEVDSGSFRSRRRNHVTELADSLSHHAVFSSKYQHGSLGRRLPILRHQGNAILSRDKAAHSQAHFLTFGFKRLVLESHVCGVRVFLVHLALRRETRIKQLRDLCRIVGKCGDEPILVAGDFNAYRGVHELHEFQEHTGLLSANRNAYPTFPTWAPTREIDFVLYSPGIRVDEFTVRHDVRLSDHLPLVLDFELS
jgi:endonuclease/exonuclease/phosphatase family metal-dependent hydrolase